MTGEQNRHGEDIRRKSGPQVARSNKETRHYTKRIIFVFIISVAVLIAMITAQTHYKRSDQRAPEREKNYRSPQPSGFAELAAEMRRDRSSAQTEVPSGKRGSEETQKIIVSGATGKKVLKPAPAYYSDRNDAQSANTLRTLKLQALASKSVVENFEPPQNKETKSSQEYEVSTTASAADGATSIMDSASLAALMQQGQQNDPNGQSAKMDFLRSSGGGLTPQGYSSALPMPQQFPYELKAGTVIPGIMVTGINSDLPGSVIAQVSENVWDTTTGRHVLIPKGTRILGVYDSRVTFGQRRVLLVWNRLIFPGGTTLDIAGSPGVDQGGYSGLPGKVDEHWWTMIKSALLASIFVAGAEVVYDDTSWSDRNESKSPRDAAAESAAGAILDMGTKLMNRASDIQPTITVRPGKRMGIIVQRDIVFPFPYL